MAVTDFLPTAILLPSLDRPQNLERAIANIHETTPEQHFLLLCVSDQESMAICDRLGEWYLDDSDQDDRRYVTRMNRLIEYLDDAKTIYFDSDDVIHRMGWLSAALQVMDTGPSVVCTNDLHQPHGTQAVIRREYLQRAVFDAPGLAFHPGYRHNFADNEMFFTANVNHELGYAPAAVVEHLHPLFQAKNSMPWDETYTRAQGGWDHDASLWKQRYQLIEQG